MNFKIKTSQFYDKSKPKHQKWSKIRHIFMGHIQIWHHIFFYQKILKYFNDFQNRNFSVLWLKWTKTMNIKQNQTFFLGIYLNPTSFFIGCKILKYLNDFYNWHFSILLQKWAQTSAIKSHETWKHVQIW